MQWSKLKSRFHEPLAESVKDRVEVHSTRYRRAHDQDGRAWITIDGKEIINSQGVLYWRSKAYRRATELADAADKEPSSLAPA